MNDARAVLMLPAALLRRMPAPLTLGCRAEDVYDRPRDFWLTTSKTHHSAALSAPLAVCNGHEWLALCLAAEVGATRLALAQWLAPDYPLTLPPPWALRGSLYDLTGGRFRMRDRATAWDDIPLRATVGRVLEHFGATLVDIDPPADSALRVARASGGGF